MIKMKKSNRKLSLTLLIVSRMVVSGAYLRGSFLTGSANLATLDVVGARSSESEEEAGLGHFGGVVDTATC